ncbi:hypothetical protein QU487_06740 [Crenobacter sp. SG2305]|uniref:hypothetical protein n=1 Tax=Crenobacter oryzisoli TaxID=3056844 RepID=UPI0025AAEB03|nr:hypothetical protein [Crenobacter sp. SG2305]MDN0082451.1 hypothetical protein [Crenobacter sp. SG2305]
MNNVNKRIKQMRVTPNPESTLLAKAVVGGAGLNIPPGTVPPEGMGAVVLFVPLEQMVGKTVMEIQSDLGLPWHAEGSDPVWFADLGL